MTSPRITFTISSPAASSLGLLQIEQQEWSAYTGRVTTGVMVSALRTMLYGEESTDRVNCGVIDGAVICQIDVYPRRPGLAYQFATSWGELSPRSEEEITETELVSFHLESNASPSHPCREILSATWVDGLVYDGEGNEIAAPQLVIASNTIATKNGQAIYGTAEVVYRTERHSYTLTIPRRDEAIDNFFSAVVYGWYEGGIDYLQIELPPGIETFEADATAACGHSVTASVTDDEGDPIDQPVTASRVSIIDYCSQEVVEDSYV
jgi:hypothetical protein